MIMIYSTDSNGRLFTDPKQHFYVDADLLREKAVALRTVAVLNQIAARLGYPSFDALDTFARCRGVTHDSLMRWILSGTVAENVSHLDC